MKAFGYPESWMSEANRPRYESTDRDVLEAILDQLQQLVDIATERREARR